MQDINNKSSEIILQIQNLTISFESDFLNSEKNITVLDDLSFDVFQGESLGLIGESGSGKTLIAYSILKLIPSPPGKIESGKIIFNNKNILSLSEEELYNIRGKKISIIPQDAFNSLSPVHTIKEQMLDGIAQDISNKEVLTEIYKVLEFSGIDNPESAVNLYPHQFSGGMLQRVLIAMAVLNKPDIIIADEPTSALDESSSEKILNLILDIKNVNKFSTLIFISHDLNVVKKICTRILILYAGRIQEIGDTTDIFQNPLHPYTQGLMASSELQEKPDGDFYFIKGNPPERNDLIKGCKFNQRCDFAFGLCFEKEPELISVNENRYVRCHLLNEKIHKPDENIRDK